MTPLLLFVALVAASFVSGIPLYYFGHRLASRREVEAFKRISDFQTKQLEKSWDIERISRLELDRRDAFNQAYQKHSESLKLLAKCLADPESDNGGEKEVR